MAKNPYYRDHQIFWSGTSGQVLTSNGPGEEPSYETPAAGGSAFGTVAVSGQSDVVADQASDTLTLAAGSNITITTNAGSDTVTIAASSGGNAFGTVAVSGQSDVVADQANDTLTLVAGSNVTITTNAGGDSVTIAASSGSPTFVGAMVKKSADQTTANYTTATAIAWDAEVYDTSAFHDNVTNNTRLTIPSGISKVNVRATVRLNLVTGGTATQVAIRKGGTSDYDGQATQDTESGATTRDITVHALGVPVSAGEYFEAYLFQETDTSVTLVAARSCFSIQQVE